MERSALEQVFIATAMVMGLGIAAQLIANRLRFPSILLLLGAGIAVGPVLSLIAPGHELRPTELFGDLLVPLATMAVALILYEGGLSLPVRELKSGGRVVWLLVSVGAAVTWVIAGFAAWKILGLPAPIAFIFGAVLTVSGPTVVLPLLRHVRPRGSIGNILKWEGILIDPIGVLLSVLVFEAVAAGSGGAAIRDVALSIIQTLFVGVGLGYASAWVMAFAFRRYWIPDDLQNPLSFAFVVVCVSVANIVQKESGLVTATVMGLYLANRAKADVAHLVEFQENLRVLLISALFVVLAATLQTEDLQLLWEDKWLTLAFLAVLIFVARPATVLMSTLGSRLQFKEKLFLMSVAPRGIVAAAVAPILALELTELGEGFEDASRMVPVMFAVIVGTVAVYGLSASPIAKILKLSDQDPQGVLILGGHDWARAIARKLNDLGIRAMIVDSNYANTAAAWMDGTPAHHGSILAEHAADEIDLTGIGRFIALTPNDQVNTLATQRMARVLGRANVFQLPKKQRSTRTGPGTRAPEPADTSEDAGGARVAFGSKSTYANCAAKWSRDGGVIVTDVEEGNSLETLRFVFGNAAIPMFVVGPGNRLTVLTSEFSSELKSGQRLLSLAEYSAEDIRVDPEA